MKKVLITGVGSILRGDDGIGVRVIDELEKEKLPENVRLHSGDVSGLDLLKVFPGNERVVIIDAADIKEKPGTIKVLDFKDIKKSDFSDKFSTHGMALLETLTLAERLDLGCEIKIVAVQPEDTSFKLELSGLIEKKVPDIVNKIKEIVST